MESSGSVSWIDKVLASMPNASGQGDTVVGYIGTAQTAAQGKNIVQVTHQILGDAKPSDTNEIKTAIHQLRAEYQKLAIQLNQNQRYLAEDRINTIENELHKNSPSGDLIRTAGNWLLENVPQIGHALVSLFLPEPVGRVVEKAGAATIEWIRDLRQKFRTS